MSLKSLESRDAGKPARPVRAGGRRKRTCSLQAPRRRPTGALWDPDWGGAFWKTNAYAPWPVWIWLNGHTWAQRQCDRLGIGYTALDNGFRACRLARHLEQQPGVHRFDDHRAFVVRIGAHDHVAGQHQPDLAVDVHRPVRQRRVAGAEYEVVLHVRAEFLFQRRLHVDLGEDAEPLLYQRVTGTLHRVIE
jgi:hypothetical protein